MRYCLTIECCPRFCRVFPREVKFVTVAFRAAHEVGLGCEIIHKKLFCTPIGFIFREVEYAQVI